MNPIKRICLAAASALFSLPLAAQVPFTGSYSQDFNSMGTAGTAPPAGWAMKSGNYSESDTLINFFKAETQWIVAQRGVLNIAFVSHMGDMTNTATAAEYVRSNTAMSILEDPATTGLPSGIPWGGQPGNHDSSGWDTTYGPARFAGRAYFQGNYPTGSAVNSYQDEANGGDSWLRYFTFSPANNMIYANVIRCNDGTRRTDAESQFEMPYSMQGSAPWTALGTVNVPAAGTSASLAWTGLSVDTQYEWYATVTDGVTPATSGTRSFTAVTPSPLPIVTISATRAIASEYGMTRPPTPRGP